MVTIGKKRPTTTKLKLYILFMPGSKLQLPLYQTTTAQRTSLSLKEKKSKNLPPYIEQVLHN